MTAPAVAMAAVTALRPLRGGTPNNTSAGHTFTTAPSPARAPRLPGRPGEVECRHREQRREHVEAAERDGADQRDSRKPAPAAEP